MNALKHFVTEGWTLANNGQRMRCMNPGVSVAPDIESHRRWLRQIMDRTGFPHPVLFITRVQALAVKQEELL